MTGDIARAITLATYGTAYLKYGSDISFLTLNHPTFKFENKVEFLIPKKRWFFSKVSWQLFASNPIEWLNNLKQLGCKEIKIGFEPDNSTVLSGTIVPDHQLAGFVGGGGKRYIITVFDDYAEYWQSREEVTDKEAADNRIWSISYGRVLSTENIPSLKIDVLLTKQQLKDALDRITAFAKEQKLSFWQEIFDKAIELLNSSEPYESDYDRMLVPIDKMELDAKQLLASAGKAWVFGGMGSWNDMGFDEKEVEEYYDQVSSQLYSAINKSYIAAANSI